MEKSCIGGNACHVDCTLDKSIVFSRVKEEKETGLQYECTPICMLEEVPSIILPTEFSSAGHYDVILSSEKLQNGAVS